MASSPSPPRPEASAAATSSKDHSSTPPRELLLTVRSPSAGKFAARALLADTASQALLSAVTASQDGAKACRVLVVFRPELATDVASRSQRLRDGGAAHLQLSPLGAWAAEGKSLMSSEPLDR